MVNHDEGAVRMHLQAYNAAREPPDVCGRLIDLFMTWQVAVLLLFAICEYE